MAKINVHGGIIKISSGIQPFNERSRNENTLYYKENKPRVVSYKRLMKTRGNARNRRTRSLLDKYYTIMNEPSVHISIVFPKEYTKLYKVTKKHRKYLLKRLRNYIGRTFKDSWFIYKIEYSEKAHIHMHLIGSFSKTNEHNEEFTEKIITFWNRLVNNNEESDKLIKVTKYLNQISYLCNEQKWNDDIKCKNIIGRDYMSGYINRNNLIFYEQYCFDVNEEELLIVKEMLKEYSTKNCKNNKSILRQLKKDYCHIAVEDKSILYKIVQQAHEKYMKIQEDYS